MHVAKPRAPNPLGPVVVAGHVCLDVIPTLSQGVTLQPGRLFEVGAAQLACGGGVANVGGALLRLGAGSDIDARLVGHVGADAFGDAVLSLLSSANPGSAGNILQKEGESTSYTLVLNPPGVDRTFLHHPGCNDTFRACDVPKDVLAGAQVFYFGYPPLMRGIYEDGGVGLAELLARARAAGTTTVLDMATPDPNGASGRVGWRAFLARCLPHVDVFMPSLDEVAFMLGRPAEPTPAALRGLGDELLCLGAHVVVLKLGALGLYLCSADLRRLERSDLLPPAAWRARELWSPVFTADVRGTTGAGDATIAGFIMGLLSGRGPEGALSLANAVGAFGVEAVDAGSGVPSLKDVDVRVACGWPRALDTGRPGELKSWPEGAHGVRTGPHDAKEGKEKI